MYPKKALRNAIEALAVPAQGEQIELDREEAQRQKHARLHRLNTVQVPILRFLGFGMLALAVYAYNLYFAENPSAAADSLHYAMLVLAYCGFAGVVLHLFYGRWRRFDLGFAFLIADVPILTAAVYLTGGEQSWMVSLLLLRVADQATSGTRKALFFAHLTIGCFLAMTLYLDLVEDRAIVWRRELTKAVLLYSGHLYVAITARGGDLRRRKVSKAIDMSRRLIRELQQGAHRLELARQRAEAANQAKSQFLANMSHEIRTPMNAVVGLSEMLMLEELTGDQKEQVRLIQTSANALLRVIDDILDLSKIEAGKLLLERVACDLAEVIDGSVRLLRPRVEAKGLDLVVEIEKDLPVVSADPSRLRQVLINLLSNAIKFTEKGQVRVVVRREQEDKEGMTVRFSVEDTGIGIAESAISRLFEPFTQADQSTTRQYGGTGLGLPICKRLVEIMDGKLDCVSAPGQGSTFWFIVPLAFSREEPLQNAEKKPSTSEIQVMLNVDQEAGPSQVLLVEDNAVNRMVASRMLASLGIEVVAVASGAEALASLEARSYDLIFMDCQMPVMDGYEATAAIRRLEGSARHTPIVALTAHTLEGDREKCLAAGMDDYLAKPLRRRELAKILAAWMGVRDPSIDVSSSPEDRSDPYG